jgi:hypothetical protein
VAIVVRCGVEDLDPPGAGVGDVDPSAVVGGHPGGVSEAAELGVVAQQRLGARRRRAQEPDQRRDGDPG